MPELNLVLPTLDLVAHNLIALVAALVVAMLLSELVVAAILRASSFALRASVFNEVTAEDRAALRRRVKRRAFTVVGLLALGLAAAAMFLSFTGRRALDLLKGARAQAGALDLSALRTGLLVTAGIVVCALVADAFARAITAGLGKGLSRSTWFANRRESLLLAVARLRTATRVLILCTAAVLVTQAFDLPAGMQRTVLIGSYALCAFHLSRLVVSIAYILVDLLFETSGKLTSLESPLRHLGSLTHIAGLTKRTIDYFVYIGAATWVADELTPDTWISQAGRAGIRIIAIFYLSRVLVELSSLFIRELFLGSAEKEDQIALQRRQTLLPVAMGLVRYGIYFSALVMVLRAADIDPTPLLAGAGVVGVAIGLGAQAFVGDIVAGFFILFEDLLLVGDFVEVSHVRGKVEEIGVRITKIRDDAGVLHAIPNGEVRKVANHSRAYVNAVIDVYVPYEEDLPRVRELLAAVAEKALAEETGRPGPVQVDVEELTEGSVMLRVVARVPPGQDKDVGDALRARVVQELRGAGVGAPRARRAVLIDSTLRVGSPVEAGSDDEDTGPPKPFEPPSPAD